MVAVAGRAIPRPESTATGAPLRVQGSDTPNSLWQPAYVGLGSNLGDPRRMLAAALDQLAALPQTRVIAVSPYYRSIPFGPVAQSDFLNAVAGMLTQLQPRMLLQHLRDIEVALGRQATRVRWGPREVDLDLLVHGETRLAEQDLVLPHVGIPERDFVLYPLRDIAAELQIPGMGRVVDLAARVKNRGLQRID